MKRIARQIMSISSMVLVILGALVGGGFAMAGTTLGSEGPDPLGTDDDHDPVDPDSGTGNSPDDDTEGRIAPGDHTAGQNLDGTQASSTQMREGGLEEDEWDTEVTKFQPWRTPLLRIARAVSKAVRISNWSIKHGRVGGETLDGTTTADITANSDGSITLSASNFSGNLKPFQKNFTILVPSVQGYSQESTSDNLIAEGGLMLMITEVSGGSVTARAVNGIPTGTEASTELDSKTCPDIASGTYMILGSAAMSESQLLLPPENFQPRYEEFYVQKKGFNIVFTGDFEQTKKKFPFKIADIKADAILKYNMKAHRTYWAGVQSKFPMVNGDGSIEDVFTTKGILWQLTNLYSYAKGGLTLADLVAISKLQFTTFSQSDEAYVFCGKDAIEELLNLTVGGVTKILDFKDTKEYDLDIKTMKTTFGTLKFIYDQGLDMLGYKDAMVVVDLKGARRYVKFGQKESTNDMSKGAGEIRDARRFIRTEADGIALRGYNSILVVPNDKLLSNNIETQMRSKVVASATLPDDATDGLIIALTADYELDGVTYSKGTAYEYDSTNGWTEYTGYTSVIM